MCQWISAPLGARVRCCCQTLRVFSLVFSSSSAPTAATRVRTTTTCTSTRSGPRTRLFSAPCAGYPLVGAAGHTCSSQEHVSPRPHVTMHVPHPTRLSPSPLAGLARLRDRLPQTFPPKVCEMGPMAPGARLACQEHVSPRPHVPMHVPHPTRLSPSPLAGRARLRDRLPQSSRCAQWGPWRPARASRVRSTSLRAHTSPCTSHTPPASLPRRSQAARPSFSRCLLAGLMESRQLGQHLILQHVGPRPCDASRTAVLSSLGSLSFRTHEDMYERKNTLGGKL